MAQGGASPPPANSGSPYGFSVYGPRNLPSPNWKDLFRSTWKEPSYKRAAMACFVQAAYMLELDRQDLLAAPLAPNWWQPFKYKLSRALIDPRDSSFYGAILEFDRATAAAALVFSRPVGAPAAVLALRGTLLSSPTRRRDIQDDLRLVARESLRSSVRFAGAMESLKSMVEKHGGGNVCVAGHSLGAGLALQVGRALAEQDVFLECHLFNPPSVSLSASLKTMGRIAGAAWKRFVGAKLPPFDSGGEEAPAIDGEVRWVPNLYVNDSDYICCSYNSPADGGGAMKEKMKVVNGGGEGKAKVFVVTKGPRKFLEAHGLQQWWSDDVELQEAIHRSEVIERQLRSLYPPRPAAARS